MSCCIRLLVADLDYENALIVVAESTWLVKGEIPFSDSEPFGMRLAWRSHAVLFSELQTIVRELLFRFARATVLILLYSKERVYIVVRVHAATALLCRRCRMSMMLMAGWLAVETVTCQSLSDDLISHRGDTRSMRCYVVIISAGPKSMQDL